MNTGIIIYRSKYGASKKYANWIAEKTGFLCSEESQIKADTLTKYHTIIFCSGIYASGISGLPLLRKNYQKLRDKKLAIFCVGASPYNAKAFEEIKTRNLKEDLKNIPLFYGRGAWDEKAMTFKDRTLCRLLHKAVAKTDPSAREPWMEALMAAAGQERCDWTDEKYLVLLMQYVEG